MLNKHGTHSRDAQPRIGGNGKLPLAWKGWMATESCPWFERRHHGNGKLPLVWMMPQQSAHSLHWWCRTLGHGDDEDGRNQYMDTVTLKVLATGLWDEIETIVWTEML